MPPICVNLKARFGTVFRLSRDECSEVRSDPWGWQIEGRRGTVYPHGGDMLAVEVSRRTKAGRTLAERGYGLHQDGDDEQTFLVPVADLEELADVLRLPRRRRLSAEHRERLAASNAAHRFPPGSNRHIPGPETTPDASADLRAV